jgi:hypothetical protein
MKTWKAPLTRNLHRSITCHYSINQQQPALIPSIQKLKGDLKKGYVLGKFTYANSQDSKRKMCVLMVAVLDY